MEEFKYKVVLKNKIEQFEYQVLNYLYLPIAGLKAISLYKLLIQEASLQKMVKNTEFFDDRLVAITGISIGSLNKQIAKLEGLGLIQTLENVNKRTKAFHIYAPLEPQEFFDNGVFNSALLKKLGEKNYEIARYYFRDETIGMVDGEYKNVSSKFSDVYKDIIVDNNAKPAVAMKSKPKKTNCLIDDFDYNALIKAVKAKKINIDLEENSIKSTIMDVYSIYKFTIFEFAEIIQRVYDKNQNSFIPGKFYNEVADIYFSQPQYDKTVPEVEFVQSIQLKAKLKIKEFETISSEKYLPALLDQPSISKEYLDFIHELRRKYKLRDGVINCLFDYSYFRNQNKIVKNYIYKIAETFKSMNIKTADVAMDYLQTAHRKSSDGPKDFAKKLSKKNPGKIQWDSYAPMEESFGYKLQEENDIDINELLADMI